MSKRLNAIVFVILITALLLTACERPASVAPVTSPTTSGEIPFPVATQPQIMKDILSATQTAAALQGTLATGGLTTGATSTPAFTYVTPTSQTPGSIVLSTSTPAATATPTAIAYPTPTPGIPAKYTIKADEFPYCIARRFNVDPEDLLSLNGLGVNSIVSVGTKLQIPQSGKFPGTRSLKNHPTAYTVVYGDTIGLIACGFGDADPNTILAANGLSDGATLTPGQVLQIP